MGCPHERREQPGSGAKVEHPARRPYVERERVDRRPIERVEGWNQAPPGGVVAARVAIEGVGGAIRHAAYVIVRAASSSRSSAS